MLVVQLEGFRFVVMDQDYRFRHSVDTLPSASGGSSIDRIYDWSLAGTDIVAFADIKTEKDWISGLVRFPLARSGNSSPFTLLSENLSNEASRKFHRIGYSYIASIGNTAYAILMGHGIRLVKNEAGQTTLTDLKALGTIFPPDKGVPALPGFIRPSDYPSVMRAIEEYTLPVGLYSSGRSLYVISRHLRGIETQWRIHQIDPAKDQITATLEIPSHANHLLAVPGSDYWAFY